MKILLSLTKKELNSYLNSPLGYVVVGIFLSLSYFLYYRTTLPVGIASLRGFFDLWPYFLAILAPALTMSLITEEKDKKTLELLLAHPLSETTIVFSKFLGVFFYYLIVVILTASLIVPLVLFSKVDPGLIFSQYLGALFTGAAFLSLGILASALSSNQITSFLVGSSLSFLLVLLGLDFVNLSVPQPFGNLFNRLSVLSHHQSVSRGLLDLADLVYFLSFGFFSLSAAIFFTSRPRAREKTKSGLYVSFFLVAVIAVLLNLILAKTVWRLDLTKEKIFTLSKATKETVKNLDDILTIKLFASPNLPPNVQTVLRETEDRLKDYQKYGPKIIVERYSPSPSDEEAQLAQSLGIIPIQFNTIGTASYQVQAGFLGLSLRFGQNSETIPFIQETGSLESELTRRIKKISAKSTQTIGLNLAVSPTAPQPLSFSILGQTLGQEYRVKDYPLKDIKAGDPDLLIVAVHDFLIDDQGSNALKDYLKASGKVIFLIDKFTLDASNTYAIPRSTGLESLLAEFGLTLNQDLVFDQSLAETIRVQQGSTIFLLPYPFWFKTITNPSSGLGSNNVFLLWPSAIQINPQEPYQVQTLISASKNGGIINGQNILISPERLNELEFKLNKQETPVGVLVTSSTQEKPPILSLINDAEFVADAYALVGNQNISFLVNLASLMISGAPNFVPIKKSNPEIFVFSAPWQPVIVQWSQVLGVPLLAAVYGFVRIWRRKQNFKRVYQPVNPYESR